MKSTTVFLLGVIVFTSMLVDCSAAPKQNNIIVTETDIEKVNADIDKCEVALANALKAVKEALSKATGDEKETLTIVHKWLAKDLTDRMSIVIPALLKALEIGTRESVLLVIPLLDAAIEDTNAELADKTKLLKDNSGELVDCVKPVVVESVQEMIDISTEVSVLLKDIVERCNA